MSAELIHQMYIAYYQRPADPGGHQFWLNRLNAEGGGATGWAAISADFIASAESDALYGTASTETKLAQFYTAAFGRSGTSTEVTALLGDGTANLGVLAYNLVTGASGDDLLTVNQKVDYAEAFVATLDPTGLGIGPFQFFYEDPSLGRNLNSDITKDSDVSSSTVLSQVQGAIPTSDPAAASPALPTAERTTDLTSGPDVVALTGETTDQINAALGGTNPTLSRTDQIDGGSAQDIMSVAMDGNFLLGFNSSGFVKNVEIFDLAASTPSVTPKTFNFTGVTGVDQINVGAGNAPIIVSNISDTDITLNLSGQSTGAFDVGFASGTISGSGSSLTIGVSDLGSDGNNISLTADLITDLDVVSYGRGNYIDLGGGVNDLQTISVSGKADVYIDGLPTSVSGFTAAGAAGDVTIGIDASTNGNTHLSDATATITGGAGFDTIRLDTGGTFAPSTTSFEEIFFDGSNATVAVKATGMNGLNTLTFSGVSGTAPSIKGLGDQALTVNAILESAPSGSAPDITGTGALTVNLNGNPTQVALASTSSNHFDFDSSTTESVSINVGAYVSASGTYTLDTQGDVNIVVDSTSTFGSLVRASGAQTVTVSGNGDINATISGREANTISINAGSGTLAIGSSAASSFNLTTQSAIAIGSASKLSGVQNMTVDVGQNTADLTNLGFQDMRVLSLSGAGSASTVLMNDISGSGNAMTLTLSGLAGGFSAANIQNQSGNITIEAVASTGTIDVGDVSNLGSGNLNIVTGTAGNFSAATVESIGTFTLDASAHTAGTGSISFGAFSANGAATISMGSGSGDLTLTDIESASTFTVDASKFGGTTDVVALSAGGNTTFQLGSEGYFSASEIIISGGSFILDGSNATTGQTTIQSITAGNGMTISMGTGTGGVTLSTATTGGNFTLDGANFGGEITVTELTASGAVVVSLGSLGHFSATDIASRGAVTVDGSNATTGRVTMTGVSAGGNMTVSMGTGTGSGAIVAATVGKNFVLDAQTFNGTLELGRISASGTGTISVGPKGDLSATEIKTVGNFTLDAGAATSGSILLSAVSAGGNFSIAMGTGTGGLTLTDGQTAGKFTLDAAKFGGSLLVKDLTASGTVAISIGTQGNLSADGIHTTGSLTIDGAAATTGLVTLRTVSASGVTISMGTGTGDFANNVNIHSSKGFLYDGANFDGTVKITSLTASGTSTISVGDGDFTAAATQVNGALTLDKSTSSTGNVTFTSFSAGGNASITMGAGSGSLIIGAGQGNGTVTINATQFTGLTQFTSLSAGAIAVNLAAGARGDFSAQTIFSTSSFTLTQTGAASGDITISTGISASGSISLALGSGNGSGDVTMSTTTTNSTFSLTGSQNGDVTLANLSASAGITVNMAGSGSFTASSLETGGTLSFSRPIGSGESVVITNISGADASITMGAGSSHFSATTVDVGSFTFDSTLSTEETTGNRVDILSASGAVSISLGANAGFASTAVTVASAGFSLTKGTGSSDVTISVGLTADGAVTITGAGSGAISLSSISTGGGFTFNGTGMGAGGASYVSATYITATSGDITFQFGTGANGFVNASAINTVSAFNLIGASLNSADIVIGSISATESVSFSNLGQASGTASIAAIDTDGSFTFNAGATENINIDIGTVSASAASIVLGGSDEVAFSAIVVDTLTVDGSNFKGDLAFNGAITTSGMTVTMGGNASAMVNSAAITTETLTINANQGGPLSAELTSIAVSAFTIVGTEDAGKLTISAFNFSASGTITGSGGADSVAVSAMTAAGQKNTFTFDMRDDDTNADVLKFTHGAGEQIVKILNFKSGTDSISADIISAAYSTHATALSTTTAAAILTDALNTSIAASDLATANGTTTAMFTMGNDIFVIAHTAGTTGNALFDDGEVIFQFVNTDTLVAGDIGAL